jgi:hypothetical protein
MKAVQHFNKKPTYMNPNITKALEATDGNNVISSVPDKSRAIALVDLNVLRKLVSYLPTVPLDSIKAALKAEIDNQQDLERLTSLLEEEIAFHKSVNLIQEYSIPRN